MSVQNTLRAPVAFSGVGLHSGMPARVVVHPASADYGLWFRRTDVTTGDPMVPARWDAVDETTLNTRIANPSGVTVQTTEHLMAALAGCGIHNALIEIDGPEVPILDGSAMPFVARFLRTGLRAQAAPVRTLRILAPVEVRAGEALARLEPSDVLEIDFRIAFDEPGIGEQHKSLNMANGAFVRELCDSRTFCRQADVEAMRARGLARGGSYDNAVVFDGGRVLSPGGLRHMDEPVRHKMLDALGDLALAGGPILGRYVGVRAGHGLTNRLLRALFADPSAWVWTDCARPCGAKLPGVGVVAADVPRVA
jgi:UDP-3-O-[3-hydroxymyristoyl] N-acetylglucosamine deacetylase